MTAEQNIAASAFSTFAKPNKFRIGEVGPDMIEHTLEIQVIPDDNYETPEDFESIEYPCGVGVCYVRHNWITGNHMELSTRCIWGVDGYSEDEHFADLAKDLFYELCKEHGNLINAQREDINASRVNRVV